MSASDPSYTDLRQAVAYSRYPTAVRPIGLEAPAATYEQKATVTDYTGAVAIPRSEYIAGVIVDQTGTTFDDALSQVNDYRARTGYYPAVGQNVFVPGADKIYGPGAATNPAQAAQRPAGAAGAAGGLLEAGIFSGGIGLWLAGGAILGAILILSGKGKRRG